MVNGKDYHEIITIFHKPNFTIGWGGRSPLSFLKTYSAARADPRGTTRATVSVAGPDGKIATVASADVHNLNAGAAFVSQRCWRTGNGPLASCSTSWDKCRCQSLGREALVPVMRSSDLRKRNHLSAVGRLGGPSVGCILPERQVRARPVVVGEVGTKDSVGASAR